MDEQFPGNSQRRRPLREELADKQEPVKRVSRVVEGEVVRRKKPLGRRMKEMFLGGDSRSVGEYVFADMIIPGIRDMVADVVTTSVERMIYGESRPTNRRPGGRGMVNTIGHTRYDRYSSPRRDDRRDDRAQLSRRARTMHDFDEIILPSRVEAEEVLSQMYDVLEKFEVVTVADLYELCNLSSNFTDNKWGWTDLAGSTVTRTRAGYLLDLPRPEVLKD